MLHWVRVGWFRLVPVWATDEAEAWDVAVGVLETDGGLYA